MVQVADSGTAAARSIDPVALNERMLPFGPTEMSPIGVEADCKANVAWPAEVLKGPTILTRSVVTKPNPLLVEILTS